MFNITLKNLNRSIYGPLYIGTTKRLATATSVKFIDNNHLCATNLVGMYLDLYEFDYDMKTYKLLDTINTTYNNDLCITDLIDYHNNLLVSSNFDKGTQTFYQIFDNKLLHYKSLPLYCNIPQYCHGVKFYKYSKDVLCFTYNKQFKVMFVNYTNNNIMYEINYLPNFNPKDIAFINENKMLIYYSTSDVVGQSNNREFISRIVYLEFNLINKSHQIIDTYDIKECHGDCIVFYKNIILVNNQIGDNIMAFCINNEKIQMIESLDGYDKPHGIDINYDNKLIAVSNYGDNTIKIKKIPDNILQFMAT